MILSRVKISPQQRYDLEDFFAEQASARSDAKLWTQKFLSESNMVMGGFTLSGIGLKQATVAMSNAALIIPQSTFDFSYFIAAPADPDIVIPDADLVDGARNYVEAMLTTLDGVPLVKAFWDPEANSGAGAEFNQIVNTITDIQVKFVVSTGGFSGSPDRLPIAIVDTDGTGTIKVILDRRTLYGRLAKPNSIDNNYAWGTKQEPVYQLVMSGVTGTFVAGEVLTIGSETATVVAGGTTSITFNCPTGINFATASAVSGATSGAAGTVNTIFENFLGVDKSLTGQKNINDALMTEIKLMKGTRFWWQTGPSIVGNKQEMMSTIAGLTSGARVQWDGSKLRITDDSLAPATTDNIAAIRVMSSTINLNLRRADDGKEVVTVTTPSIPDAGSLVLTIGSGVTILWDDSTANIQSAWNASGAYAATVSGNFAAKKIVITANAAGLQTDVVLGANTLTNSTASVTPTLTIKQGLAADGSIAIADGQVLYVDIPSPLANTNYSGVGAGAGNFKVAARGSVALVDSSYWLAYREGANLIWRFAGELQAGESSQISDNVPQSFLDAIGLASEASMPSYSSNIRGVVGESLVSRLGVLTNAMGDAQEDRSGYLRADDVVVWSGTQLSFTTDIVLEFINTKSGTTTTHTVLTANSPIALADGESAWILVDRSLTSQNCTLRKSLTTPIPAQTEANKNVFVLFKRRDSLGSAYLYIPFIKQVMSPGQSSRIGASGGSGSTTTGRAGEDAITIGATSLTVIFSTPVLSASYNPVFNFVNTIDASPGFQSHTITNRTVNGFTVKWNAPMDTGNYKGGYIVPGSQVQSAEYAIGIGQTSLTVTIPVAYASLSYTAVGNMGNFIDGSPQFQPATLTAKTLTTATFKWNGPTDTANSKLIVEFCDLV